MTNTVSPNWNSVNYDYLMAAVERVGDRLQHWAACRRNDSEGAIFEEQPNLDSLSALVSTPPALEQLCTLFNLSPIERDVLLLCVGMETIPNFKSLCSDAMGDEELRYPSFGLANEIFPTFDWSVVRADRPLQRWQLVEIGDSNALTQCPLRIDPRILCYLFGQPGVDEKLAGILKLLPEITSTSAPLPPSHQKVALELAAIWETASSASPILQLCGSDAVVARAIVTAASASAGYYNVGVVSASVLPTNFSELYQLRRRIEREALLSNSILLLDCLDASSAESSQLKAISQFIEDIATPVIVTTRSRLPQGSRLLLTFDIPTLTPSEQRTLWQMHLGEAATSLNGTVDTLISQFNLSSVAIQSVCTSVLSQSNNHSYSDLNTRLWDSCRVTARPRLDALAQRIQTSMTWDDLILPDITKNTLKEIVSHVRYRHIVYSQWGMAPLHSRGMGITVLFYGESGLGKTTAAEIIAKALGLDIYRIDLSAVVNKYIGETEKNLARLFEAAEASGVVLSFEECDALFGKRGDVKDARDRYANLEVSYLLQRMEAYRGLAILTTNKKEAMDEAFQRRLRFIVEFPFPKKEQRAEMWRRAFPPSTPTDGLDINKLMKLVATGANIRNIALNAAFHAADKSEPIQMKHILIAAKREAQKAGKTVSSSEVEDWV